MMNTTTVTNRYDTARRPASGFLNTLLAWGQVRRQRLDLAALDARGLSDIGVSREDARKEVRKPFWMMQSFR